MLPSEQPVEQREGLARAVLREQHPRQHEIFPLLRVARFVAGAEATLLGPAGGRGGVTLGELQPCPLRGHGVNQAGHGRACREPPGLAHRFPCSRRIALGLPDPRQRGHASGHRLGVVDRPEPRDPLGDVLKAAELTPLVFHLGHAYERDARGRRLAPGRAVISSAIW